MIFSLNQQSVNSIRWRLNTSAWSLKKGRSLWTLENWKGYRIGQSQPQLSKLGDSWDFGISIEGSFKPCQTPQWSTEEGQEIRMDQWLSEGIQRTQETVHGGTSFDDAWPSKTLPNRNGRFKVCHRSGTHPIRLKWQLTPHLIHLENLLSDRTQLRDIWQRTLGNHSCLDGMATLHSRLSTYNDGSFGPQKLDLLLRSPKVKPTTGTMVSIPIRIWYQTHPYTWTQNDPVRCPITMTRSLPWGRHQQWRHHCVTWWSLHLSDQ